MGQETLNPSQEQLQDTSKVSVSRAHQHGLDLWDCTAVTPGSPRRGDGTPVSIPGLAGSVWEVFLSSRQLP